MIKLSQRDIDRLGRSARDRAQTGLASRAAAAASREDAVVHLAKSASKKPGRTTGRTGAVGGATYPASHRGRLARIAYDGPEIAIDIALAPRPKARARTFVDDGALLRAFVGAHGDARRFIALVRSPSRGGERRGGLMRTITPADTKRYEEAIATLVARAMADAGMVPFVCPVEVVTDFRFEGDPQTWPTAQDDGDLDNLLKAAFDGMNKVAYADDRLIVRQSEIKQCAVRAGISVRVRPATP